MDSNAEIIITLNSFYHIVIAVNLKKRLFQHIKICESTQWSQLQNEFPLYRFIQKIIPGKPAGFCTFLS